MPTLVFNNWDLKEVQKRLGELIDNIVKVNKLFINGDHWQNGDGYIGPRPRETQQGSEELLDNLKKGFISRNVIREVTRRHKNGVAGIEPRWAFVPRAEPKTDKTTTKPDEKATSTIKQIENDVTGWWDLRNAHKVIKDAAEMSLWGRRGVIRLYIPEGLLEGGGLPKPTTLPAALRHIYIEALDAEQAGMLEDPETKTQAAAMITVDENNKETGELVFPAEPFVDPEKPPLTMIKALGDEAGGSAFPMELGGRLTMFEIHRELMITEQIQQSQKALNLDLTIMPRNIIQGGFLERIFLAAAMPGHWTYDDKGNKKEWIPGEFETGAGTTNFVAGQEIEDEATGKTTRATPQVHFREPTDVAFAIAAKNSHYQDILEDCDQAHVLIVSDATPSGKSRQEARADFEGSLRETQTPTQDAGRWLLETVLAMAEFLMKSPGKWTNTYRAEFECLIDSGPADSAEEQGVVALREASLISEETAMSRVRILDVAAERGRRNAEPGGNLGLRQKQFEVLDAAMAIPGVGLDGAAEFLGFSPEEISLLKKGAVTLQTRGAPPTDGSAGPPVAGSGAPTNGNLGGKPRSSSGARQRARPVTGIKTQRPAQ